MRRPSKAVVIGLDAVIAHRLHQYAMAGLLPNLGRLIREGVYAENYLVPYPTVTPENWTTIATGANIGTHGITGFRVHLPGEDLDSYRSAFDTSLCRAEYLWDAVERAGGRTILINWPCSWPPTHRKGWQLGGQGLAMNEVRRGGILYEAQLCDGQLITTIDLPSAVKVELKPTEGWPGMPSMTRVLEARVEPLYTACVKAGDLGVKRCRVKGPRPWWLLVVDPDGSGFSEAMLAWRRDYSAVFTRLKPGEWSPVITGEFETVDGPEKGVFRCKLVELSSDGQRLRLLVTPICALEGYAYPPQLAREIAAVNPLAVPSHVFFDGFSWGWYGRRTFIELLAMEHRWFADAATYLMKTREWTLLMTHMHAPDWLYHYALKVETMDPSTPSYVGPERARELEEIEVEALKVIDEAVGRIVEAAGEDSLIIVVSDHGIKPKVYGFNVAELLANAGLVAVNDKGEVDLKRSKAVPGRGGPWIYVNLKDRFSHGIVEPEEYEAVRDEIIKALYDYTDPGTGLKPVALAVRREDARLLGLYGPRVGDVVYALRPEYGAHHGQLPTAELGIGSLKGLLILKGPGIKKGYVLKRTVYATDIVPTICSLLDIPVPRNAEGGIIYQALEGFPDEEVEEVERLPRSGLIHRRYGEKEESFQVES